MTTQRFAIVPTVLASLVATPVCAAGVGAGTQIDNTASATFDDGPTTVSVQSNTVSLRVDELLDVAVTSLSGGATTLTSATSAIPFRVTNTGNGAEAFGLSLSAANGGNQFDAVFQGIALDSNGNGAYDAGVDQIIAVGGTTGDLAADTAVTVFALVALPSGTGDGATSQIRLSATAVTGSGTPGTIYAGAGTNGGDAVVGSSTASSTAAASLVASSSTVTLAKTATIADPFGGATPVPGAIVTYTIAAKVGGSGTANNLKVSDAIPAGTTYRTGSLTLQGISLSDASDADAGAATTSGVTVNLGNVTGGTTKTVTFQVTIN